MVDSERGLGIRRLQKQERHQAALDDMVLLMISRLPFHRALLLLRITANLAIPGVDSPNKYERERYLKIETGTLIPPGYIVRELARDYLGVSGAVEQDLYDKATRARAAKRAVSRRRVQ